MKRVVVAVLLVGCDFAPRNDPPAPRSVVLDQPQVPTVVTTPTTAPSNTEVLRAPTPTELDGFLAGLPGAGPLTATIHTTAGDINCSLNVRYAPRTVANFVGLAMGKVPWRAADGGLRRGIPFYDGLTFHRAVPGFMIQGGDPKGNGSGGPGYQFANETSPDISHVKGTISMANAGPDTNGSQFFIMDGAATRLDGSYNAFGHCTSPDVVAAIARMPTNGDRLIAPVTIRSIEIKNQL